MADNKKLMQAVEEELQNLTGEIYLKMEERFNQLLAQAQSETIVQPTDVKTLPEYLKIEKSLTNAYQQIEKLNERIELKEQQVNALNSDNIELKSQLTDQAQSSEQLDEQSQSFQNQISNLNQQASELTDQLQQSQQACEQIKKEFEDFQKSASEDLICV